MSPKKTLGYYLLYILTRPLAIMPLRWHQSIGKSLGKFVGKSLKYRRDVVLINLSKAFPEKNYDEIEAICDKFYGHFGKLFCESIWYGRSDINSILAKSKIVTIENPELLGEYYDKGKTFFALTSHCGNWELFGGIRSYCDPDVVKFTEKEVCSIYKKLSSPAWDAFMYRNRCSTVYDKKNYDGLQESDNVLRYAVSHRRDLKFYICNIDQYPYGEAGRIPITFLGQNTYSMLGIPTLAHKLGTALMYISYKENEDDSYSVRFSLICEDASKLSPEELVNEYYSRLEEDIKAQPWNYLWTHKRWK